MGETNSHPQYSRRLTVHAVMSNIFVTQLADGPRRPVVLSHALGLDHTMWLDWAATQAGQRPVLAYDHRGHGRSDMSPGLITMQTLVDDAAQIVQQWQRGPVIWLGLSMGGMAGQGLAIQRPDLLCGLVLAHTAAVYPPAAQLAWAQRIEVVNSGGMAAVADLVTQRYLNDAFRADHPAAAQRLRSQLLGNNPTSYAAHCRAVAEVDWLDALYRITCPTRVLAGALDLGATPAMALAIQQRIPGAHIEVFENASHLSPLEQPAAFQGAVHDFLKTLDTF
jgi:3-oxoadipate enol-lactonase